MKPYIKGYNVVIVKYDILKAWLELFSSKPNPVINYMIFRFSTSIQNFVERVRKQDHIYEWTWRDISKPTAFIGLYHEGDWLRILIHRGPRLAFWCGGDILRLQKKPLWQKLLKCVKIDHVCENEVEQEALRKMGIKARIHPILFFDDWEKYPLSYKDPKGKPHVWLTCHPGREREYGVELVEEIAYLVPEVIFHIFGIDHPHPDTPFSNWSNAGSNKIYHGHVPSEKLDKMIRGYHAGLRTCEFDGCSHVTTKGTLLGQWSITRIKYPFNDHYETKEELIKLLKKLKFKKKPNLEGRKAWLKIVSEFPWQ